MDKEIVRQVVGKQRFIFLSTSTKHLTQVHAISRLLLLLDVKAYSQKKRSFRVFVFMIDGQRTLTGVLTADEMQGPCFPPTVYIFFCFLIESR